MRYDETDRESENIEDRRNDRGGGGGGFPFPGGGGGGMQIPIPMGGRGGFSITTLLIIGALMLMFGMNPLDILTGGGPDMSQVPQMPRVDPGKIGQRQSGDIQGLPGAQRVDAQGKDELGHFVRRVLADTEDVWSKVFTSIGQKYTDPTLVMFNHQTPTKCGPGLTQMGPFYCPLDQKVYIDLAFYEELKRRFHASGDFAQAYVVAHEVGHHVQTLLGISDKVQQFKESNPRQSNAIQVRMELQADCFAGVWAALNDQMKHRMQPGDIESGLNAAAQIGDDMIQKQTQGYVVPESFTHGSSQQRVRWFKQGYDSGNMQQCETFRAKDL